MRQTTTTKGLPKPQRGEKLFTPNTGSMVGLRGKATNAALAQVQRALATYTVTPTSFREVLGKTSRDGYVRVLFTPGDYYLGDGLRITANGVQFYAQVPGSVRWVMDTPSVGPRGNIATVTGNDFVFDGFNVYEHVGGTYALTITGQRATVSRTRFEDCNGAVYLSGNGHTIRDCISENSRNTEVIYLYNADSAIVANNRLLPGDDGNTDLYCNSTSQGCSITGNVAGVGTGTLTYYVASGTVEAGNVFNTIVAIP